MRPVKTTLLTATLAAALGFAATASADTVQGTITDIDLATNRITLNNGDIFKLYTPLRASQYQVGQQVSVTWGGRVEGYKSANHIEVGAANPALSTAPAAGTAAPSAVPMQSATAPDASRPMSGPLAGQVSPTTGIITAIDPGTNRMTLSNGDVFKLGTGLGVSDYRVGQQVRVSWAPGQQGYKEAHRIEPVR